MGGFNSLHDNVNQCLPPGTELRKGRSEIVSSGEMPGTFLSKTGNSYQIVQEGCPEAYLQCQVTEVP